MLEHLGTRSRILLLVAASVLPALALAVYVALEDRSPAEALAGSAAVMVLLLVSAWHGAGRLMLAPLRVLLEMTRRVQGGDYGARTGFSRSRDELSQLGAAFDEMAARLQSHEAELQRAVSDLREQAITDPLTGLYNRRYFRDVLDREIIKAKRTATPLCVILLDIDYFKQVNDTWGHDAGDCVIREIAALLRASVRGSDVAVRHGGEEFALLLPEATLRVAHDRAENLRRELEAAEVLYRGQRIRVTASFGVAEYGAAARGAAELMRAVDNAMYAAKAAGRNRVMRSEPEAAGGGRPASPSRPES